MFCFIILNENYHNHNTDTDSSMMMMMMLIMMMLQHKPVVCVSPQVPAWLQQHKEMIGSSESWMVEARTWLAAPCTYTTAKCLRSHVNALQVSPLHPMLPILHCSLLLLAHA